MKKAEGKTQVEKGGVETTKVHKVDKEPVGGGPMAQIEFGAGMTIPLGNFTNAKVWCQITLPAEMHEIEEVYEFATNWVNDKLNENIESIKSEA